MILKTEENGYLKIRDLSKIVRFDENQELEEKLMHYNFDEIIDRQHTNSINTDGFRDFIFHAGPEMKFPYADDEFIRMWIADMEFACAEPIRQAIRERVDRQIFGYTIMSLDTAYHQSLTKWCQAKYDWSFPREELCFSTGVIPALYQLVEIMCQKGEKALMVTPAYGFFKHAVDYNGIDCECSPLIAEGSHFRVDFDDLEERASHPGVKVLIWCNPQNPSGTVWTAEELKRVAAIAQKNDLWLISDEIHCDILRQGVRHIPLAKVTDYKKLVTCMSASKVFNMAGLQFSNIIIRDPELRAQFVERDKNVGFVNPLSIVAHKAAYDHGDEWLDQLKTYLDGNFELVRDFLHKELPLAQFEIPKATYLAWVNLNAYLKDVDDLPRFFAYEAGILLEGGDDLFVGNAKGYVRLNLAMPRATLRKALERLKTAIEKHVEANK